ncbi:D-alanyl-D-alanine carboxypeptidase/D-alanyl-D-alanine-endopeptidase [Streptomyces sp. B6B3]|uniref:D-alanyl-D-alanine carboxypeptidase/D-alanyl-D-alanine endopeptidase n=1 Tax=Streptomyces sp. B6B3 TaxID=3153570 RepID=UPI00325CE434
MQQRPRRRSRPRSRLVAPLAAGLALTLGGTLAWNAAADGDATADLAASIDEILADPRLDGAHAGVVVLDAATGETLYDHEGADRLTPASNAKLLTSAAAVDTLGADYRYVTDLATDGTVTGGTLAGDLYLRGSGDPTMLAEDYDALAADLAAAGVTEVSGDLVADDTRFDDVRLGTAWAWDSESDYFAAQTSALTLAPDTDYDSGNVYLETSPGATEGDKPQVTMQPANDYVTLVNEATTVAAGEDNTLNITREHGTNTIVISGQVPADAGTTQTWNPVWEPTGYAAAVFADALAAHGIGLAGDTVLGRATPADAEVLASHESMTLAELLVPFLKLSNNMHAEALVKTLGHEAGGAGTWDAGLDVVEAYADGLGVTAGSYLQVDGSGLSRMSTVSPESLATLLVEVRDEPWFDAWYEALPIACQPDRLTGGTLRTRMCDTPASGNAHAKTGSLTGASGLSGYVTAADGRELVFSILFNDHLGAAPTDLQDAIVATLAGDQSEPAQTRTHEADPATEPATLDLECSWLKPAATC